MRTYKQVKIFVTATLFILLVTSCSTYQPKQTDYICSIFHGETDWYETVRDSNKKWGTPIWVIMAIMHQESHFVSDARPDREWFLFIPLPRRSSAFGYAQAQNPAWEEYIKKTGNHGGDRDDFEDAVDFIGWYTHATQRTLGISKWDAYGQYLAYHEGRGGYKRSTYKKKPGLIKVANKVKSRAATYNTQLKTCKADLDDAVNSWF